MGNRCSIITQADREKGEGTSIYLHWNGGYSSVKGFLEYCKLRGFRCPEDDEYGWARLCQIAANFLGGDGLSIGIGAFKGLDTLNDWDNGTWVISGWDIVDNLRGLTEMIEADGDGYGLGEMLAGIDASQPELQQLGRKMMADLHNNGKNIGDVSWSYHYTIERAKDQNKAAKPFEVGKSYKAYEGPVTILERDNCTVKAEFLGEVIEAPIFHWKNGAESFLVDVKERNITRSIVSMEE